MATTALRHLLVQQKPPWSDAGACADASGGDGNPDARAPQGSSDLQLDSQDAVALHAMARPCLSELDALHISAAVAAAMSVTELRSLFPQRSLVCHLPSNPTMMSSPPALGLLGQTRVAVWQGKAN